MSELNEKELLNGEEEKKSIFNLQTIWTICYLNWYWILLSVFVSLCAAVVYLRYTVPVYSASMKVLVKDSEQNQRGYGMALEEMGLMSNSNGFDNELEIIRSATVSTRAVKRLKLYVSYFQEGRFVNREHYKTSPVLVDLEEDKLDTLSMSIPLVLTKKDGVIFVEGSFDKKNPEVKQLNESIKELPATINTPFGKILLCQNPGFEFEDGVKIYANINSPKNVGRAYARRLNASSTTKTTTVAAVSFVDTKVQRSVDYLRELVDCYNEDANEDKNEVARKTEEFIAERLDKIRAELDETEEGMEAYKRGNELINLANDATSALTNTTNYQKELVEAETQLSLLKSMMDYMDDPTNYLQTLPTNLGLKETSLVTMITKYNDLVLRRNRYLKGSSEENPLVVQVTQQMADMWPAIRSNMGSLYSNMEIQKKSVDNQYKLYASKISQTPTQERVLNNIGRQQTLKADLYLTLLQKREENFIQLYSTASKARMIDEPMVGGKVSPKDKMILMGAFGFGLVFPIGLFMCLGLLRFRIEGREDVEGLTKLPILADIPFSFQLEEGQRAVVVRENRNDMMEEAFRGLRTNLSFVLKPGEKVILATSCIPGEGKTFVATNLAMSFALLGKKVIVVGLDIRKPQLVNLFGLKADKRGIVNFLCGSKADFDLLEEQITPSGVNANMHVLPAGIIPPNPAELLSSSLLKEGIDYLCSKYDYVILDTPPVGLVADTLNIGRCANVTLFVARADYSPKANFELINGISADAKLPNCNIILNGMDLRKRKYGHYYGYGKYGRYGKYGKYNKYSKYGHYGVYGRYGHGHESGKEHIEK